MPPITPIRRPSTPAAAARLALLLALMAAHPARDAGAQTPVPAAPPAAAASEPELGLALAIVPGDSTRTISPNAARYEFGEVNVFDKPVVEHAFRLKNDTGAPITISHLVSSCGCTGAVLGPPSQAAAAATPAPPGAPSLRATLEPGQEIQVQVTLKLADLKPGRIRKTVSVAAEGQSQPAARLEMSGTILPSVRLEPAVNDLGEIPAGQARSFRVTAILDARIAAAGPVPDLSADNPSLRITPVRGGDAAPAPPGMIAKTYEVTIAEDAPLGTLSGRIAFAIPVTAAALPLPPPQAPAAPAATDAAATAAVLARRVLAVLRSTAATVSAQVTGDLSAQPQLVSFGAVRETTTRTVTLTGTTASAVAGLKLETAAPNPYVSARLLDPEPGQAQIRTIAVTLDPAGARTGIQSTRLKVTLANGQRMEIPVNAYIMRTEPAR